MEDFGCDMSRRLLDLMQKTGYPIVQNNGQRIFGPPPDWTGPPPPRGCEVFVGKLPRDIYEDDIVPVFSKAGKIYELRLMMDFSGSNRGYAFVTYTTKAQAAAAIRDLAGYEIRPRRHIGVVASVDNCRLFIGNIPKTITREQVREEMESRVTGVVDVIMYPNCFNRNLNRGYAFVEFVNHRAAAMARRSLVPGYVNIWNRDIVVDWAEPEPEVDEQLMNKVKVLYARNFDLNTTPATIKAVFEEVLRCKIENVKKFNDYAFIHFFKREHAELALRNLQNCEIDGSVIAITWSKPVNGDLYRIQKLGRGNAKFTKKWEIFQPRFQSTKQSRHNQEPVGSPKDEGFSSCTPGSPCHSLEQYPLPCHQENYMASPAKLEEICKRFMWPQPMYNVSKCFLPSCGEMWTCIVELPHIGPPLLYPPRSLGPFRTEPCYNIQQAQIEAASTVLYVLMTLRLDQIQQPQVSPSPYPLVPYLPQPVTPPYLPCEYLYMPPTIPVTLPSLW